MKKFTAAMLTMALAGTMLTGCGSTASNTTTDDSAAKDNTAATDTAAEFKLATDGKLTMATNAYFEPWEYYDGENIVGIDPEVAQAIADKLGLELEIMDMDFDSIVTAVSAGKADMGMAGMTVTEERQKNVDFSQTYASAVQAIIVPDGSDIKTADDMEGKKIGVMQGFTGDLSCTEQFGEDAVVRFNKSAEAVMALTQGKIDCIVIDNEPAKKIIEANSGLTILDSKYSQEDYAIAFAKGNDGLRDAVDAALGELISDGTVEQIMNSICCRLISDRKSSAGGDGLNGRPLCVFLQG